MFYLISIVMLIFLHILFIIEKFIPVWEQKLKKLEAIMCVFFIISVKVFFYSSWTKELSS